MGSHIKTTVEISDALLEAAKRRAAGAGTTLRALIEEGLRRVLESERPGAAFVLRDASVDGSGVTDDVREGGWDRVVELTYRGRGG